MVMYVDEEEVWKCQKHPSRRRRSGICPTCLRERLSNLCPDCASVRPCGCCAPTTTTTTPSSSSSSSFSRFFPGRGDSYSGVGSVGLVSNLIESEPTFRRSRSVAVSLLRSRSRYADDLGAGCLENGDGGSPGGMTSRTASFWRMFRRDKSKRSGVGLAESASCNGDESRRAEDVREAAEAAARAAEERSRMMRKSRSVALTWNRTGADSRSAASGKGRSWYFPSPIKAFRHRQSKAAVAQERSPLYRG